MKKHNTIKNPLFNLDEEVILCSKAHPQCNGESVVIDIIHREDFEVMYPKWECTGTEWYYDVGVPIKANGERCWHWREDSLRKKHRPSEHSYKELLNKLKRGTLA